MREQREDVPTEGGDDRERATGRSLSPGTSVLDLASAISNVLSSVDQGPAIGRVADLRDSHPGASTDELVRILIKKKCQQAGAVGAATSGTALVPGIGTLTALTLGAVADITVAFRLQADLVLEIAAAHGRLLTEEEKQRAILLVTGLSAGANQLLTRTGGKVSVEVSERMAQKWLARVLPVIGVALSAGTNVLATYLIGQRAHAYFGLGPEQMKDWKEGLRAITGVDERKIAHWLASPSVTQTSKAAGKAITSGSRKAADAVIAASHGVQKGLGGLVQFGQGVASSLSLRRRRKSRRKTLPDAD